MKFRVYQNSEHIVHGAWAHQSIEHILHWSSADVKVSAKINKADRKDKNEAKVASIQCIAKFEHNLKIAEDMADAMPRPKFETCLLTHETSSNFDYNGLLLAPPRESDESDKHLFTNMGSQNKACFFHAIYAEVASLV